MEATKSHEFAIAIIGPTSISIGIVLFLVGSLMA